MKNSTCCIGLIFEYAPKGVVSLEVLYRKFVVELTSDLLFHVYVSSLNCSRPRTIGMLCSAFVLELCVWMEIEYKHGIEGERDNAFL